MSHAAEYNLGNKLSAVELFKFTQSVQELIKEGHTLATMALSRNDEGDVMAYVTYFKDPDPDEDSDQDSPESPDEHPQSEEAGSTKVS